MEWRDHTDKESDKEELEELIKNTRAWSRFCNKIRHSDNRTLSKLPYIAIEGVNLVGKSTAVEYIKTHYEYSKYITTYHEPDENTVLGKFIRENVSNSEIIKDPYVRNALYLLGIKENIHASERNNKLHLTSRSILSNIAYSNLPTEKVIDMIIALKVKIPDYIILITASEELIKERYAKSKYKDVIESKGVKYILKIQEKMITIVDELVKRYWLDPLCYCNVEADNDNVNNIILTAFKDNLNYLSYRLKK